MRSDPSLFFEPIEPRVLFAAWNEIAQLTGQEQAATSLPSINGKGVGVAVIDSGINYNLPSLGGGIGAGKKVVAGYDFVDNDTDPMDTDGHGTEVAGVIAANPFDYNGAHYSGVAPSASLIALRVTHGEDGAADSTIEEALDWVIANHTTYNIKVINISLGSGNYTADQTNNTLSDEFATLASLNILVMAASGNSGNSIFGGSGIAYPAADKNVAAVGAVNSADAVSTFTQRGSQLDLLAPGEGIVTTSLGGGFTAVDGTSFASPFAAGAAALLRQASPSLNNAGTLSILRASGTNNRDGDNESGTTTGLIYPRINIWNALALNNSRKTSSSNKVGSIAAASDIAYDQQDVLHVAYYDGIEHTIKYATRDSAGLWSKTQIVDTGGADVGVYLSIAIDNAGKPSIAYFDSTNADLKYAHFDGAAWSAQTLDSDKNVGAFPSLAFDSQGDPVISYWRKSGSDLRLMTIDSAGNWSRQTIDSTGDVGAWTSISMTDDRSVVAIAYADLTNGDLKYARYLDGAWTLLLVDDLDGVGYTSLNIHNNQAFISYQDFKNGDLKFAKRENSQWVTETVYTPGNTGQFSNLVFDSDDTAHIVFWSKSKNLVYQAVGTFGSWTVKRVNTGGAWLAAAEGGDDDSLLSFVSLDSTKRNLQFGSLV